jgi:hypothetical protein
MVTPVKVAVGAVVVNSRGSTRPSPLLEVDHKFHYKHS